MFKNITGISVERLLARKNPEIRWVFVYPWRNILSKAGEFAEVRRTYTVSPVDRYTLRIIGGDDCHYPAPAYRIKQLLVDGEVVWDQDVGGGAWGMQSIQVNVTRQVKEKSSVTVALRVVTPMSFAGPRVEVWWGELKTEGLQPAEGSTWTTNVRGQWKVTEQNK